ncbi:27026_t:CDS:2 [Gigaspora margarita]|uniref:27026_t:CDS:1 n=1 Tax=Gigaspora margarita TaxID=4874 RepID=A0ABN7WWR5_GIGMA|nr:27026_t:CDS:2 [Gigaspora margarita]
MSHSSGQQRGPYVTTACTNCRRRHTKCSEEATCAYCASHNLKCTYIKSGKKRGPKATKRTDKVFENNFNEAANIEQEHTFTLTEYQFSTSIPSYFSYGQIKSEFSPNQICTDTNYIMPNSNTSINFNNFPNNFFTFSYSSPHSPSLFPFSTSFDSSSIASNLDYLNPFRPV